MATLNIDLGELPWEPPELVGIAQLANIACGGHAGSARSMRRVLRSCLAAGTRAGAHPSFVDRARFGRVRVEVAAEALRLQVRGQVASLVGIARQEGVTVGHVKPHGALYHAADADRDMARAVLEGAVEAAGVVAVIGPAGGALSAVAGGMGLEYWREGFADRGVDPHGKLIPRGLPGAMIEDSAAAAERAQALARDVDTICVHGDTPGAVAIARAVRAVLS